MAIQCDTKPMTRGACGCASVPWAGAYFGHWYLSFSVISSLPRLLTVVGVWEAHLQHVLGVFSYPLHSAATDCN